MPRRTNAGTGIQVNVGSLQLPIIRAGWAGCVTNFVKAQQSLLVDQKVFGATAGVAGTQRDTFKDVSDGKAITVH